jgi:hypothetical protein
MKLIRSIFWNATTVGILVGCGFFAGIRSVNVNQKVLDISHILSVREIQRKLCEQGYPVTIDNIYGPETVKAFDRWYCDKDAERYFAEIGWNQ